MVAFFLVGLLISTYFLSQNNFSDSALLWVRLLGIGGLLFLIGYYIFFPLWRSPSLRQVARFLEEQHPELEERLSTAVEMQNHDTQIHPEIRNLIVQDTQKQWRKVSSPRFYYPRASLTSVIALLSSLVVVCLLLFNGPEVFPYSLTKIFRGWYDESQLPLYSIAVTPGSVTVGKRADVQIRAQLLGFDSDQVQLVARYENEPQWEETTMRPDLHGEDFAFIFFDVRDRIEYYVMADGIQSEGYAIEVSEIPRVENIKITLLFPKYTGLPGVVQEEEGDIRALEGTEAKIVIQTDQPVKAGAIHLENEGQILLQKLGHQQLSGTLRIKGDDYYRIHLQDQEDFWNPASEEYVIEALQDQPPIVSFNKPGRDQRVTNIEEVFTEIKTEDDYGVSRVSLRFSINGESEQEAQLSYRKGSRSLSTSHTFYLEEYSLEPGDFVSYYAEAADSVTSSATDIYFFEVEPFDREYYQAQQGGGMQGGAGQDIQLSKRQKEIIAATFKLQRDRKNYPSSEFSENAQTLALVQQRLMGEAQTILERIERRGAAMADARFKKMSEHLGQAVKYMESAHQHLNQLTTKEALKAEQKSFRQLLRAEALFKEVQVSFSQSQGGGSASAEDLADLVDLELDRTKNQYETLQQSRQANQEQALDEAMEKLKELARRQEQVAERRRRQSTQGSSQSSQSQQQLIEEAERLARQLERLSRQQQDPQLQNAARKLNQAMRDMRQSQNKGANQQEAQMRAQQALERLKEAQNALSQQRRQQLTEGLEQLKEGSERLVREQKQVLEKIDEVDRRVKAKQVDSKFIKELRRTLREKSGLQEDLYQLESNLHQTARQLNSQHEKASRKLKQAALDVRDQRIPEKMQEGSELLSRGWTDMAKEREQGVMEDLEDLADKILQAESALESDDQSNPQDKLQQALNQVGSLVEDLESLQDRTGENQQQEKQTNGQESQNNSLQAQQGNNQSQGQQQDTRQNAQQSNQSGSQEGTNQNSGQQPSEQASQQGQDPSPGGSTEGAGSYSGARANNYGINPRQIRREWQERLSDAQELGELLNDNPDLTRSWTSLVRGMRQMDAARLFNDPQEVARLKSQIVDGFRQLELEINRALEEEFEHLLRVVNEDEIPPEFRERVEEYYRLLASKRNR